MSAVPCKDCFSGFVHDGTPTGTITTIHGLPVYVVEPDEGVNPKGLVVIISDAFGMESINNKILADRYAKRGGFLVYLPEFIYVLIVDGFADRCFNSNTTLLGYTNPRFWCLRNGNALSVSFMDLTRSITTPASWLATVFWKPILIFKALSKVLPFAFKTRASVSKPHIFNFFKALRSSPPPFPTNNLKIGAAGFCWGGKYTVLLAQDSPSSRVVRNQESSSLSGLQPLIDCAFTAHPSLLSVPKDIDDVVVPLSVTVGDDDMYLKGPLAVQTKEILEKKKAGGHQVVILPDAKHGFAIRTDPDDHYQMECAEKAELQAIEWFKMWFV